MARPPALAIAKASRRSAFLVAVAVLLGDAPRAAADSQPALRIRPPSRVELPNGLAVIVDPDPRTPFVSMQLRYAVGSRDDPPALAGLASLTTRMMARRTAHVPDGMYERHLERAGAGVNVWQGSTDWSAFVTIVPKSAVPMILWLWSDQMGFFAPSVDQALVDEQRAIFLSERRQKIENGPLSSIRELELAALYPPDHPYHRTPLEQSLDTLTASDVVRFFDAHYAPEKAVLVLSGDVDDSILPVIAQYFGPIPRGSTPTPTLAPQDLAREEIRLDVSAAVRAPVVAMVWPTAPAFSHADAELSIIAKLLATGSAPLLVWHLVDQRKIVTSISARQHSRKLGSDFEIQAQVAPRHSADEAVAAIDEELARLRPSFVGAEVIARDSAAYVLPKILEMGDPGARTPLYASYGLDPHDFAVLVPDVTQQIVPTPQSIHETMNRYLPRRQRVLVIVSPDPSAPAAGVLRATTHTQRGEP